MESRYGRTVFNGVPIPKYQGGCTIFFEAIFELLDDPSTDSIISWSKTNRSFVIWDQKELIRRKLPRKFYSRTFTKFVSNLKFFGFHEIERSDGHLEFGHPRNFVRGQPDLATDMFGESVLKRFKEEKRLKSKSRMACS